MVDLATINEDRKREFMEATLAVGHGAKWGEACVIDGANYVAGGPFADDGDAARIARPLVAMFIRLNDRGTPELREKLKPLALKAFNTRGDGQDDERRRIAAEFVINTRLPHWLELIGLTDRADELRQLEVTEWNDQLRDLLREVRDECWAAREPWRNQLHAKVKAAVEAKVAERGKPAAVAAAAAAAVADADAVAAAVADAVADAVAAADVDAVADAAAVAAAVAVADADAVAAAVAAAAADAVAAAVAAAAGDAAAAGGSWDATYTAVYAKVKPIYQAKLAEFGVDWEAEALELLERLIDPS